MPEKKTTVKPRKKKEIKFDPVLSPSASYSSPLSYSFPPYYEDKSFEISVVELKVRFFWRYIKLKLTVGKDVDDNL